VWDAERKAQLAAAGLPWPAIERTLDRYAAAWTAMHREACEATRVRGEQSEDLLDRRMACLDERLRALRAVGGALAGARAEDAVRAAASLPRIELCADAAHLRGGVAPPADPAMIARLEPIRAGLAEARIQVQLWNHDAGLRGAEAALAGARAAGYPPAVAEALLVRAQARDARGETAEATADFSEAVTVSVAARHDVVLATALAGLAMDLALEQKTGDAALRWAGVASALGARLGGDREIDARHAARLADLLFTWGRLEESEAQARRALAILEELRPDHPDLALLHSRLATVLEERGDREAALAHYGLARDIAARTVGPDSPSVAIALVNLSGLLTDLGRREDALRRAEEARRIVDRAVPDDNPLHATVLTNLAVAEQALGRHARAIELARRAVAVQVRFFGDAHPRTARSRVALADVYQKAGDREAALAEYRGADDAYRLADERHPRRARALSGMGKMLVELGRRAEAQAPLRQALALVAADGRAGNAEEIRGLLAQATR
jgi:tetratricopeptide (TPR) repeat protein